MPHKRNPRSFENVKSLWKEFAPRIVTVLMDQISEHQRDLTNSASMRFLSEIFAALDYAARRLQRAVGSLEIRRERMRANFDRAANEIVAEPLYLALALGGVADAYDRSRRIVRTAREEGTSTLELAQQDPELGGYLRNLSRDQLRILESPERYVGDAARQATETSERWIREMTVLERAQGEDAAWLPR